jgi:hypothetical protein
MDMEDVPHWADSKAAIDWDLILTSVPPWYQISPRLDELRGSEIPFGLTPVHQFCLPTLARLLADGSCHYHPLLAADRNSEIGVGPNRK